MRCAALLLALANGSVAARLDSISDPWRWSRFGSDQGMEAGSIRQLVETREGIAWVRTLAGLASFDGYRWRALREWKQPISQIGLGASGRLLVLSEGVLYEGGVEGFGRMEIRTPQGGPLRVYSFAALEPGGELLLSTEAGELWRWDGRRASLLDARPPGLAKGSRLDLTGSGEAVWMTPLGVYHCERRGLPGLNWRVLLSLPPRSATPVELRVNTLAENSRGQGAASVGLPDSMRGIWEWDPAGSARRVAGLEDAMARTLDIAADGTAFAVLRSGEVRVRRMGTWTALPDAPPRLRQAYWIRFRPNGDLWAAARDGLYLYREPVWPWQVHRHGAPDARNTVHAIVEASDGCTWIGSQAGLEVLCPGRPERAVMSIEGVPVRNVTGLVEDRRGNIWMSSGASFGGAWKWDGSAWHHYGKAAGLTGNRIHAIQRGGGDRVWLLSTGQAFGDDPAEAGAFEWTGGGFRYWGRASGLPDVRVYGAVDDGGGGRWFAAMSGVSRLANGRWTHWRTGKELLAGTPSVLAADPAGGVWFGDRYNGLGRIEAGGAVRYYGTAAGMAGNQVTDIEFDGSGALWAATTSGLARYSDGAWSVFREEAGLTNIDLWPIAFRGSRLCVGTLGSGMACNDLERAPHAQPRVEIDRAIAEGSRVHLGWRAYPFWGEIPAALVQTRYRLDEGEWSGWSHATSLRLEQAGWGEHALTVQAMGLLPGAHPSQSTARFEVPRPLYWQPAFLVVLAVLLGLAVALGLTVIERRRALAAQDRRFRALIENSLDGISLVTPEGRSIYTAPAVERILGIAVDRVNNRQNWDKAHPDDTPTIRKLLEQAVYVPGQVVTCQARCRHRDGSWRWLDFRAMSLLGDPSVGGIVVNYRDITESVEAAEQVERSRREAEAASRAKSEFLATMSHEIRTPMNGIIGMTSLLGGTTLEPDQKEYLETIRASADSLLSIINDILDLSRIEAGRLEIEQAPFDLEATARAVVDLLRVKAWEKDLQLRFEYAAGAPRWFRGDAGRVRQVLVNLVGNALKFTDAGSIAVSIEVAGSDPAELRIAVADTGIGIPEDQQQAMFEKFRQGDSSNTRRHGGSGLGLAITRSLVELMGGSLTLTSTPGRGSEFVIHLTLPLEAARNAAAGAGQVPVPGGLRVLLVDDNAVNRRVAQRMLERLQCNVTTAEDGAAAIEAQAAQPFDLVLMDCQMPVMDGLEATRRIRSTTGGARVPILAMTANAMKGSREACLEAGMDDYLAKPVSLAQLRDVLAKWGRSPAQPVS